MKGRGHHHIHNTWNPFQPVVQPSTLYGKRVRTIILVTCLYIGMHAHDGDSCSLSNCQLQSVPAIQSMLMLASTKCVIMKSNCRRLLACSARCQYWLKKFKWLANSPPSVWASLTKLSIGDCTHCVMGTLDIALSWGHSLQLTLVPL